MNVIKEPMLCESDLSKFLESDDESVAYYSDKEDGVRCIVDPNTGEYFSRDGKLFPNFDIFTPIFKELAALIGIKGICFDGEVTDIEGKFSGVMTQVHRHKEIDPSIFVFHVFDITHPTLTFRERRAFLESVFKARHYHNVMLHPHTLIQGKLTQETVDVLMKDALDRGKEGLVFKYSESFYTPGRSFYWCKVKKSDTLDLTVKGVVEGKGKLAGKVGKFICEFEGKDVKVAPGKLTHAELEMYFKYPPKLIEVEYQEVTEAGALRHPRCVRIREDK